MVEGHPIVYSMRNLKTIMIMRSPYPRVQPDLLHPGPQAAPRKWHFLKTMITQRRITMTTMRRSCHRGPQGSLPCPLGQHGDLVRRQPWTPTEWGPSTRPSAKCSVCPCSPQRGQEQESSNCQRKILMSWRNLVPLRVTSLLLQRSMQVQCSNSNVFNRELLINLFFSGALPLAVSEDLPLFPPFNKPSKAEKTEWTSLYYDDYL